METVAPCSNPLPVRVTAVPPVIKPTLGATVVRVGGMPEGVTVIVPLLVVTM